jgi:Tfp pilus assembly protein PilF/thiol-disulfide isomerase/thioredoxin
MQTRTVVAAGLTALLLLASSPASTFKRTAVGDSVQDFGLETTEGQILQLSQSLGRKATLVVFWATWSPRSPEALADFQKLYEEHGPDDLQVVAVNVEHQDWDPAVAESVAAFAAEHTLRFPMVFDKDLSVFDAYGVIAVPSTVLADPQGQIVELLESYSYMTRFDFRERVLDLLGVLPEEPEEPEAEVGYQPKGKAARYYQMGTLLLKKQQTRRALKAFQGAVKEDPDYADVYLRMAEIFEAEGMADKAAEARTRVAELGAGGSGRALQAATEGSPEDASPRAPETQAAAARYVRMGNLLLKKDMAAKAVGVFQTAVAKDPENPDAYLGLAEALDAAGRAEEAEQARARAKSLGAPSTMGNDG